MIRFEFKFEEYSDAEKYKEKLLRATHGNTDVYVFIATLENRIPVVVLDLIPPFTSPYARSTELCLYHQIDMTDQIAE